MNTIIIYSSKYGCTAECAEYLKSGLSGLVTLINIDKMKAIDKLIMKAATKGNSEELKISQKY